MLPNVLGINLPNYEFMCLIPFSGWHPSHVCIGIGVISCVTSNIHPVELGLTRWRGLNKQMMCDWVKKRRQVKSRHGNWRASLVSGGALPVGEELSHLPLLWAAALPLWQSRKSVRCGGGVTELCSMLRVQTMFEFKWQLSRCHVRSTEFEAPRCVYYKPNNPEQ